MLVRAGIVALAVASAPSGCDQVFGNGSADAHQPGDVIGVYRVSAALTSNTCGQGAFGAQQVWEFDVELARAQTAIFWDNGQEIISGTIGADGVSFSFDTGVIQDMRTEEQVWLPPCSLSRHDRASGTLSAASGEVASFTGQISFDFTPTAGSQCEDLVGLNSNEPVAEVLPCGFAFAMQGQRAAAP